MAAHETAGAGAGAGPQQGVSGIGSSEPVKGNGSVYGPILNIISQKS